jgi:hypothetical protein
MTTFVLNAPPPANLSLEKLADLLNDLQRRELRLTSLTQQLEQRYGALSALDARLNSGQGNEHPDWEDAIEWHNALEAIERFQLLRSTLEWLQHSMTR